MVINLTQHTIVFSRALVQINTVVTVLIGGSATTRDIQTMEPSIVEVRGALSLATALMMHSQS
jgi:hypothetical protein